jgi:hypothetical protein
LYGSKGTGFYRYVKLRSGIGINMERTELLCSSGQQQQQQQSVTTNVLLSLTTNKLHRMPKNPNTKAPTKAVSTIGPYQVQGGLKGSGSSLSQERGGKPMGTSSVSRSKSSRQQNDGQPKSSSSGGSKQQDHGITGQPGKQISPVYNSGKAAVSKSLHIGPVPLVYTPPEQEPLHHGKIWWPLLCRRRSLRQPQSRNPYIMERSGGHYCADNVHYGSHGIL